MELEKHRQIQSRDLRPGSPNPAGQIPSVVSRSLDKLRPDRSEVALFIAENWCNRSMAAEEIAAKFADLMKRQGTTPVLQTTGLDAQLRLQPSVNHGASFPPAHGSSRLIKL